MAIANASQVGPSVYAYDERGKKLFSTTGTLVGFTGATLTVKIGRTAFIYDEQGKKKFSQSCS